MKPLLTAHLFFLFTFINFINDIWYYIPIRGFFTRGDSAINVNVIFPYSKWSHRQQILISNAKRGAQRRHRQNHCNLCNSLRIWRINCIELGVCKSPLPQPSLFYTKYVIIIDKLLKGKSLYTMLTYIELCKKTKLRTIITSQ